MKYFLKDHVGDEEMSQQSRALAVLEEDLDWAPIIHTIACNSL